jgi:LysM repeat protein
MSFFGKWNSVGLAAALWVAATGCSPMDQSPMDEEKEPHYVLGKSRVNAMEFDEAIKAFEESLEANPHSAQAHYQLAMLFENQESDPAAAIYHYQQYLKYNPTSQNAEIIAQHIASCKQQLAADVLQLPSAPAAQQQLEKLTEENRRLHDQLTQWQAYYAAQQAAARTNPPTLPTTPVRSQTTSFSPEDVTPLPTTTTTTSGGGSAGASGGYSAGTTARFTAQPTRPPRSRTHVVTSGETMASIARKQGVSLAALETANPSVNPRKLKSGQVLNLPEP